MDALKYITPKFFTTIRNYSKGQFLKDLIAGVIVAIIALPLSIALAIASGVNPEQGLYTAVVAGFFYFLFRRVVGFRLVDRLQHSLLSSMASLPSMVWLA